MLQIGNPILSILKKPMPTKEKREGKKKNGLEDSPYLGIFFLFNIYY